MELEFPSGSTAALEAGSSGASEWGSSIPIFEAGVEMGLELVALAPPAS
jgi:hypothetical protein